MCRGASLTVALMLALVGGAYGQDAADHATVAEAVAPDAPSAIRLAAITQPAEPVEAATPVIVSNRLNAKPSPGPARVVDRQFAAWMVLANVSTVFDVESTMHAFNTDPAAYETQSWFYGRHPGRARMYGTALPLNFAAGYLSYFAKKRLCPSAHCWLWQVPMAALTVVHAGAGTWNYASF